MPDRADQIAAAVGRIAERVFAGESTLEARVRLAAALRPLDPDARNPLPVLRCQTPKCGWGTLEWHEHAGAPCPSCGGRSFALEREGSPSLGLTQASSTTSPLVSELLDAARPEEAVVPCAACSAAREEDGPISHEAPACDARPEPAAVEWRGEFCGEGAFRVEMAAAPASSEEGESGSGGREVVQPDSGGFESSAPPAEANRTCKATPSYTLAEKLLRRVRCLLQPANDEEALLAGDIDAFLAAALNGEAEAPEERPERAAWRWSECRTEVTARYAVFRIEEPDSGDVLYASDPQLAADVAALLSGGGAALDGETESLRRELTPVTDPQREIAELRAELAATRQLLDAAAPPAVPAAPPAELREAAKPFRDAIVAFDEHEDFDDLPPGDGEPASEYVIGKLTLADWRRLRIAFDAASRETVAAPPAETVVAEDLLRRCEFVYDSQDGEKYCPLCENREDAGHEESCVLGQFIAARPRAGTGEAP